MKIWEMLRIYEEQKVGLFPCNPLPDTHLHEKSYSDDWKKWCVKQIELSYYTNLNEAITGVLRITKGRINPNWIKEAWEKRFEYQ